MAKNHDERLIDGNGRWTAMDGDRRRNGHSTAMDSMAMDGKGWLKGDLMGMDEEERHERNGDGTQAKR